MPPPAEGFAARFVLGPALRTQPDRRLVSLVREGYETAFEEIVRRYGRALTRYAAAIVGSRSEDVTQDAFSKALLALRHSDAEIELRPWLFRIVRNTALNELRDHPPSPEALAEAIAGGSDPAEELERREELAGLMRRLQSLPEPQRAAIVMRELEGLGHEEIAAALGLSGGAARQAIYRGRRALRNGLGLLLPLPLLKALLAGGALGGTELATAGAVSAGGAGAGTALKAATATVLVAGAVGTGVAVQETRDDLGSARQQSQRVVSENTAPPSEGPPEATASGAEGLGSSTDDRGGPDSGKGQGGDDDRDEGGNSGPGSGEDTDRDERDEVDDGGGGSRHEPGDDRSGHGGDDDDVGGSRGPSGSDDDNRSRPSNSSGSGSGTQQSSSGPGSGSGGGHDDLHDSSGPGGGSSSPDEEALDSDSNGPGSDDEELKD